MRFNLIRYTLALIVMAVASVGVLNAGIETEFLSISITKGDYTSVQGNADLYDADEFINYPANQEDPDDGYVEIDLPWTWNYAGQDRNKMWVCVNGFITFVQPQNLPQNRPNGLFIDDDNTYQQAVIAPFWGNHYYRTAANDPGYSPSRIYVQETSEYIVVEWRDLNINDPSVPSSIANFQVKLFRSTDETQTFQGDVEFAYGLVNVPGQGNVVITQGASIGMKGLGDDFLNGLCYFDEDLGTNPYCNERTTSEELSNVWQPSGGTNKRIMFSSNPVVNILSDWGDGDTDLSHGFGGRHFLLPQNRFVTFNDVRMVMRSVTSQVPLDSILGRQAFHADADHDGRFAILDTNIWERNALGQFVDDQGRSVNQFPEYDQFNNITGYYYVDQDSQTWTDPVDVLVPDDSTVKHTIETRSRNWQDDIPADVPSLNQVYWSADENDARWIVSYLSVKVPSLPWIYDTTMEKGKLTSIEPIANDVRFGEPMNNGTYGYKVPVYLNGKTEAGVSAKFNFDAEVEDVEVLGNGEYNLYDVHEGNVVIVTDGNYTSDEPVAYIHFATDKELINVEGIRLNDVDLNNKSIKVNTESDVDAINASPNPFSSSTRITMNIPESGNYTVIVYDALGNPVKVLTDGELNVGPYSIDWDGTDMRNMPVENGVYIYQLTGSNTSESAKVVLAK